MSEEDDTSDLDDVNDDEIDTNQDYKATLAKIIGKIYSRREQMTKTSGPLMWILFLK